jgi:hypothetical protein
MKILQTEPLVRALVDVDAEGQRRNIDQSRTPDGEAYEPLAPATIRAKQRKGYPFPSVPMKATLRMYNSIRGYVISDREGIAGPSLSNEAPYSVYQNAKRQFIGPSREDEPKYQAIIRDFAQAAVNEAYINAATGIK